MGDRDSDSGPMLTDSQAAERLGAWLREAADAVAHHEPSGPVWPLDAPIYGRHEE